MWVFSKSRHFTALGSVYSTVTADKPTNDFLYFPEFKLYVNVSRLWLSKIVTVSQQCFVRFAQLKACIKIILMSHSDVYLQQQSDGYNYKTEASIEEIIFTLHWKIRKAEILQMLLR